AVTGLHGLRRHARGGAAVGVDEAGGQLLADGLRAVEAGRAGAHGELLALEVRHALGVRLAGRVAEAPAERLAGAVLAHRAVGQRRALREGAQVGDADEAGAAAGDVGEAAARAGAHHAGVEREGDVGVEARRAVLRHGAGGQADALGDLAALAGAGAVGVAGAGLAGDAGAVGAALVRLARGVVDALAPAVGAGEAIGAVGVDGALGAGDAGAAAADLRRAAVGVGQAHGAAGAAAAALVGAAVRVGVAGVGVLRGARRQQRDAQKRRDEDRDRDRDRDRSRTLRAGTLAILVSGRLGLVRARVRERCRSPSL